MFDRPTIIDEAFVCRVAAHDFPAPRSNAAAFLVSAPKLVDLFDSQIMSRHLDLWARRSKGKTFYSIGSSGHEGTAAMAAATRHGRRRHHDHRHDIAGGESWRRRLNMLIESSDTVIPVLSPHA